MFFLYFVCSVFAPTLALSYDYIIVGGGTSGLTVANRLSEDPTVSVLVIEAGESVLGNPNVTDISRLAYLYDSELDWAYETTQQKFGGKRQVMRAGKALGGTSVMNGAAYVRAEAVQIDSFATIGNKGWSWDRLFPYYLRSETVTPPNATQAEAGASIVLENHGQTGPVHVGFTDIRKEENDFTWALNATLASMGVPWNNDLNSGSVRGMTLHPYTVDSSNIRSDAARAYYLPIHHRSNLHVMYNAFVTRVLWDQSSANTTAGLAARGVEVETLHPGQHRSVMHASREVILAAGAMLSSAILELSGVGNPSILYQHGIPSKLNLPGVGENLQDQINTSFVFKTNVPISGTRSVAFISARDLFGDSTQSVADSVSSKLLHYAETLAKTTNHATSTAEIYHQLTVQHDLIFNQGISIGEFVFILDGSRQVHVGYWGLLPFSRGNVHISSADPTAPPIVQPNYGMLDWDVQVQIAMSKYLRRLFSTGSLGAIVEAETLPGLDAVPEDASDEIWREWIGEQYTPNYHTIGTTSMLPRAVGGVLDTRLMVHGTQNVRVVDSGMIPIQLCGHPTANLYGISELAADIIKEDAAVQVDKRKALLASSVQI